jgi:hypothetical protein
MFSRTYQTSSTARFKNFGQVPGASIQDSCSQQDFDFWSWGLEKYERAVAEFDGPEFESLLREVQLAD